MGNSILKTRCYKLYLNYLIGEKMVNSKSPYYPKKKEYQRRYMRKYRLQKKTPENIKKEITRLHERLEFIESMRK